LCFGSAEQTRKTRRLSTVASTRKAISEARLLWFTFISGIALAIHERFQAYDERQASLLDHVESLALYTRYTSFLLITMLLISDASMIMSFVLGALVFTVIRNHGS